MNTFLTQDEAWALVRHAIAALGAWLVAHGYASADQSQQLVGGLGVAAAIAWSLWQKRQKNRQVAAAHAAAPPAKAGQ